MQSIKACGQSLYSHWRRKECGKAFTEYIKEQEQAHGPLMDRVNKHKWKHKVLTELEIEADEIWNIYKI